MKKFYFQLNKIDQIGSQKAENLFKPIYSKFALLINLLNTLDSIITKFELKEFSQKPYGSDNEKIQIAIIISTFSRIFFLSERKIYSIIFPFSIIQNSSGNYDIKYGTFEVNRGIISFTREFLNILENKKDLYCDELIEYSFDSDELIDKEDLCNPLYLFKNLLHMEDGYLRYDFDEAHEDGNRHPLHHYDIFYESKNTFKIGMDKQVCLDDFLFLINNDENERYFLKKQA